MRLEVNKKGLLHVNSGLAHSDLNLDMVLFYSMSVSVQ